MSTLDAQNSILTTKSSNSLNYRNNTVFSNWKYYKLYDELVVKNNLSIVSNNSSLQNEIKYIKSKSCLISFNKKLLSIFDTTTNTFVVNNINLDDFDVANHEITHLRVTEPNSENLSETEIFITVVFENIENENNINSPYIIKIYNLSDILLNVKTENTSNNTQKYHTMITVNDAPGRNKYPVSCFEISSNLNVALLGLGNGAVYLVRGDFKRDRGYKQRLIYKNLRDQMVTNLRLVNNDKFVIMSTIDYLLILSTNGVINDKQNLDKNFVKNISNFEGANFNLLDINERSDLMYVLNHDIIDVYDTSKDFEKVDSFSINITNKAVNNLYLKCINKTEIIIITQVQGDENVNFNQIHEGKHIIKATIIDVSNHITTLTTVLKNQANEVVPINTGVLVILKSGTIHKFLKKDIKNIIDLILNSTNVNDFDYKLAIKFLSEDDMSNNEAVIKKYGDYLYAENRVDEAMEQYMKCINYFMNYSNIENLSSMKPGETSESFPSITDIVIKYAMDNNSENFMNSKQNFESLVNFLRTLIMKSFTTKSDYLSLLMILLIKMASWDDLQDLVDDVDRNGNYYPQVRHSDKEINSEKYFYTIEQDEDYWYDDMILFDIDTITDLLIDSAEMYNGEYKGEVNHILFNLTLKFNKNPERIVEILLNDLHMEDFTLKWIRRLDSIGFLNVIFGSSSIGRLLLDFQEKNPKFDILSLYVKLFTGDYMQLQLDGTEKKQIYEPPKPSLVFSYFFQKDKLFSQFLESVINSGSITNDLEFKKCVNALYTTYYKLGMNQEASDLFEKHSGLISKLLQNGQYFTTEDTEALLNDYIALNDTPKLIDLLNEKESFEVFSKNTLTRLLRHVTSKPSILNAFTQERLHSIIEYALEKEILDMPCLVNVLSETNVASFGLIKDHFIKWMSQKEIEIKHEKKKLDEIINLERVDESVCLVCEQPLEVPYLKFCCGHCVHKNCLANDVDTLCPECGEEFQRIEEEITHINRFSKENDDDIKLKIQDTRNKESNQVLDVILDLFSQGALEIE
ncbi:uncharacterized protein HGUI_00466 [Hanseniaspora guilliermondii]|uniref:RING-type domain-containing protein n=1 Tax=Hanseniaspora guilliermondii TaxID=56406 RepID=A0A1L0AUM8_9ASCO|nr:uncharacterized protein HGUI_00466 [Hanseniaspora guilliermondii]